MSVAMLLLIIAVFVGVLTGALRRQTPPGAGLGALKFVLLVPAVLVAVGIAFLLMFRQTVRQTHPVAVQWQSPAPRQMTVPAHNTQNLYAAQQQAVDVFQQSASVQVEADEHAVVVETGPLPAPLPQPLPQPAPLPVSPPDPMSSELLLQQVLAADGMTQYQPPVQVPWLAQLSQDVVQEPHVTTETLYKFVVDRVTAACDKVDGDGSIRIKGDGVAGELTEWLAHRVHATLNAPFPAERPQGETWVRLQWTNRKERNVTWWPKPLAKGTLEAHVTGPNGTAVVVAKLDEKPWLAQPPDAAGRSQYVVAASNEPQASAAHAVQAARRTATLLLFPRAREQLLSMPNGGRVPHATLMEHVQAAAASDRGVVDDCLVRVDKPYGPVWYAAQLRDVSPDLARTVAASSLSASNDNRQTFAGMILGLGGMILVLGLLYLALNALTRGYFRGRLRVATAVAALLAGAVVLVLIG